MGNPPVLILPEVNKYGLLSDTHCVQSITWWKYIYIFFFKVQSCQFTSVVPSQGGELANEIQSAEEQPRPDVCWQGHVFTARMWKCSIHRGRMNRNKQGRLKTLSVCSSETARQTFWLQTGTVISYRAKFLMLWGFHCTQKQVNDHRKKVSVLVCYLRRLLILLCARFKENACKYPCAYCCVPFGTRLSHVGNWRNRDIELMPKAVFLGYGMDGGRAHWYVYI